MPAPGSTLRPRASILFLAAALPSAAAQADELYRQSPINAVGGYSSQEARNANGLGWFSEVVDNFTVLAQPSWTINALEFWGGYVTSVPGNTHGFVIRFYADNGGTPGARIYEQDVLTFTETVFYTLEPQGWHGYHYTLDLPQPFTPPAPGAYWLSIVAILDRGGGSPEPQWGWVQAPTVTPPPARQWFFSPGNFTEHPIDMSFVLVGTTGTGAAGACCFGSGCQVLAAAACTGANTRFVGDNTACNIPGNNTTPCCRADFNQTHGAIEPTVQDVFDFITAFFAADPAGDINSSGGVPTVQDVFDYLTLFFAGC